MQKNRMANKNPVRTVGIIGSGPAGGALASLLAMKGIDVTLFDDERRPTLLVGESLIPGVIPLLRKLGLEKRAEAICEYKPGVTFTLNDQEKIEFCFESLAGTGLPTYAFNAPRPAFDDLFDLRADELGVRRVHAHANIERDGENRLRLAGETLEKVPWLGGQQPDLLVDASGRSRLFAHALEIPAEIGPRKDVAHFAHFEGFEENLPKGQVIIGRLADRLVLADSAAGPAVGWAWSSTKKPRRNSDPPPKSAWKRPLPATHSFRPRGETAAASRRFSPTPITSSFPSADMDPAGR